MTDLLDSVVEAHGGLKRWNEMETVSAHLAQGGVTREMVGQKGVLDDVFVTASLHEERVSHYPFGAAGRRSVFTPARGAIENDDGTVVGALEQPRASFAGNTLQMPWTASQLAYLSAPRCGPTSRSRSRSPCQGSKLLSWSRGGKTVSSGAGCVWSGRAISRPSTPC